MGGKQIRGLEAKSYLPDFQQTGSTENHCLCVSLPLILSRLMDVCNASSQKSAITVLFNRSKQPTSDVRPPMDWQ